MPVTWVVTADSAQAEIFKIEKIGGPLKLVKSLEHSEGHMKGRELATDRPGRSFDSSGNGRHAVSSPVDLREHEADIFAKEICQLIETGRSRRRFGRLVVIAPPDFLGKLRKAITPASGQLVVETLAKNLVGNKGEGIRERLKTYI